MFEYGNNKQLQHPIIQQHKTLLKRLSDDERVMGIYYENGFYITECCDEWFDYKLTKEECLELSDLFREIADIIQEQ